MTDDEPDFARRRAELDLERAPLTRAVLDAHPEMWPRIGSAVPAGWDQEIAQALQAIVALVGETGVEIRVAQIKTKLASLRIYLDIDERSLGLVEIAGSTPISTRLRSSSTPGSIREWATGIIDAAAKRCEARCERCGAPGAFLDDGGWLRIACTAHARRD